MILTALVLFLGLWHGVQTIRSVVRPLVVRQVEKGLVFVERLQSYRNKALSALVWISCQTVSVDFYEKMLPLSYWVINPRAAANLILVLGLCIYLGNFLKDLFCAPRPREVAERLGKGATVKYLACKDSHAQESAKEYGLPSSHTMNSLVLSFFAAQYLTEHHGFPPG
eukprot:jgi/Botrbrau1/12645/Bobra.67_1s0011.1